MLMTRARPQDYFVIEGGGPISGRIRPEGNKNAALPLLAATLLTAEPVVLSNMPRIRDVETMLELLDDLGAEVAWIGPNEVRVCAADVSTTTLDERLAERIRASILLAGPLLGRFGRAEVPPPGGRALGPLHPWRERVAGIAGEAPRGQAPVRFPRVAPDRAAPSPCMTPLTVMTRPRTQEFLVIEGGVPLTGTIRPEGNKNSALALLAATILTAEPVVLGNMPRIRDVETMLELLVDLGAEVAWTQRNEVRICAADVNSTALDEGLSERIRASILLAGPLLARFGSADVPLPGGDVIGRRRVDSHLLALKHLGAEVTADRTYRFRAPDGLKGTDFHLDEASVTATENALMAAALAEGVTTIYHAACEPHVQDLCRLLVAMGAEIEGMGSNLLRVHGRESLGGASHTVCPDHIEVGSFIGMAAVTGGDVTITGCEPNDLRATLLAFSRLGVRVEIDGGNVRVPPDQELTIVDDAHDQIAKIDDGPWPAFPADMTSVAVAVATQARGTVLIFEKMFENRLVFTDKLVNMGARIILCDPHRAVVTGPAKLYGQRLSSPDIRAGIALLIASLCAEGTSVIGDVEQIDRGYERIDERLRALGARIERVAG